MTEQLKNNEIIKTEKFDGLSFGKYEENIKIQKTIIDENLEGYLNSEESARETHGIGIGITREFNDIKSKENNYNEWKNKYLIKMNALLEDFSSNGDFSNFSNKIKNNVDKIILNYLTKGEDVDEVKNMIDDKLGTFSNKLNEIYKNYTHEKDLSKIDTKNKLDALLKEIQKAGEDEEKREKIIKF